MKMKAKLSGIRKGRTLLDVRGMTSKQLEPIQRAFEIADPAYQKAIRRNPRARFALSPYKKYWRFIGKDNEALLLPRNADLHADLSDWAIVDHLVEKPAEFSVNITLRDYQEGVVEQIVRKAEGVIKLYTGFGKSIIGLKVAEALRQQTLIVVKDRKGFNQFKKDIEAFVGREHFGEIKGKTLDIGSITVATIQTLSNKSAEELEDITENFGLVIVDECHEFVTEKRLDILGRLRPEYFYGMTATDRRSDGQGQAIYFAFGEKLIERNLDIKPPRVEIVEFDEQQMVSEYHEMVEEQVQNPDRNEMIAQHILNDVTEEGRKVLVLTKRIEHFEELAKLLDARNLKTVFPIRSSDPEAAQAELMQALRKNKMPYDVILGTYSMLSTGVDIPSLDTLYIAGDLKSDVLLEQSAGRILRLFDGKDDPKIVDIQDTGNPIFKRQAQARAKFYRDKGWLLQHKDF